ncbi:uncharacterized protein N7469_001972 [Penicillium citrinum]|uniref:Ankyrin repeat protein n=1 Tax=Penicillium citrinum TaxID=5077 RepID=A0A9W9TT46_PENCI|nr:uncharacterized protein N7469_001972 [Penicillium citrinum]KAJ5240381.1 hypothetical protein N7469_001972 [Penicillium citrinum]
MVQTRHQARQRAFQETPASQKVTTACSRVQKPSRAPKARRTKKPFGVFQGPTLSSQINSLLEQNASAEDFKILLAENKSPLKFIPPLAFDNVYTHDVFYRAIEKQRLDVLPWMLERQNLDNWNILHLAVVYDNLELVQKLQDQIPELGCVLDRSGRTPLHLAFTKCNAQVARLLLESNCWQNYDGIDRNCVGHLTVEAIAFDFRKSGMCEWASLVGWLYGKGGMRIDTRDANGYRAIDLAIKWDIFDIRVKYPLMGRG